MGQYSKTKEPLKTIYESYIGQITPKHAQNKMNALKKLY